MITKCSFKLGKLAMDEGSVVSCSIYENLGFVPYGKILFRDKYNMVESGIDIRSYTNIEITIGSYEDENEKSEISIKADVVSCKTSIDFPDTEKYLLELTFVVRGEDSKLFAAIESCALPEMPSNVAISEICKKAGVKLDSNVSATSDSMNWLIVNHSLLSALNFICEHSYVADDALIYTVNLKNEIVLRSFKTSFNGNAKKTFVLYPKIYTINNSSAKTLYFYDRSFEDNSAIMQEMSATAIKSSETSGNKLKSSNKGVSEGSSARGSAAPTSTVYAPNKSPQTHDNYGIAPSVRLANIAKYCRSVIFTAFNESATSVGDLINFVDGVYDKENVFKPSAGLSGKYMILKKAYHFNLDGVSRDFVTVVKAVREFSVTSNKTTEDLMKEYGLSK